MYGSFSVSILLIRTAVIWIATVLMSCACDGPSDEVAGATAKDNGSVYRNLSDSAHYMGMQTCRSCHEDIYQTFIRTGMGKSFGVATRQRSAARFDRAFVSDRFSGFSYHAYWHHDSLFIREFRLNGKDTVHSRTGQVNYIVGSGQHTNSHMQSVNGYVTQMPMTFYTQDAKWDLPPGFENGMNTRFSRKIGLECMTCHNGFPEFVKGSENKYTRLPEGIDCERCHGPGSIHVQERRTLPPVDTSKFIDYSIVNPGKLPVDIQFDVCQRCHLQGNAILKEGRSFFDFRPGLKLSDYISVFMPRYENGDDQFIMASHAERLKMSPCFIKSMKPAAEGSLRPYTQALTCVTCHNPHISVRETNPGVFNQTCTGCHADNAAMEKVHAGIRRWNDCVSCHMPVSGSTDIPHVTIHDHYIRKPVSDSEKKAIGKFIGLYAVNEKSPSRLTRARAYLDQYEKFTQDPQFLDSARALLSGIIGNESLRLRIQLEFARGDHETIVSLVESAGIMKCLEEIFIRKSYDNGDAWATYRVAEAFASVRGHGDALKWFRKAAELAPFNLDFRNKLGVSLLNTGQKDQAKEQFEFVMSEDPGYASAYANLGYVRMLEGMLQEARRLLLRGRVLDPDNATLLLNLAACHLQLGEKEEAVKALRHVLKMDPGNKKAKEGLSQIL